MVKVYNGWYKMIALRRKTKTLSFLLHKNRGLDYFFLRINVINSEGNNTRLVSVAVISVREVSHPSDCVPPNPLKQKMINPAMRTKDV